MKGTHKQVMAKKEKMYKELKDKFEKASIVIFTDYRGIDKGLSVKDISELRKRFRESKAEYKVAKNTLIARLFKEKGIKGHEEHLKNPTAIVIGYDDPVLAAKALVNFTKEKKTPINPDGLPLIKGSYFEGKELDSSATKNIATLPSREELLASLLSLINAPAQKVLGALQASGRDIINILDQYSKKS